MSRSPHLEQYVTLERVTHDIKSCVIVAAKKHHTLASSCAWKEIDNNTKRQPEIRQGEPREYKREYVILHNKMSMRAQGIN